MDAKQEKPSAWKYLDYRKYLHAFYEHKKRTTRGRFSYRIFSNQTKIQSPNYMKLIIDGDRNLTLPHARRVAKYCELDANETNYFLSLVKWNQSENEAETEQRWSEVLKHRSIATRMELSTAQLGIVSDLKTIALFVLLQIEGEKASIAHLAKRLGSTADEVAHGLELLETAKLIHRNESGIRILNRTLKSSDDVPSQSIRQLHRQAMKAAEQSLSEVDVASREFASTTLTIRRSDLPKLKEKIRAFRDQILSESEDGENAEEVYQLNLQFFPLTHVVKDTP